MSSKNERRRFTRYTIQSGVVVFFIKKSRFPFIKPKYIRLGPVLDISRTGLLFEYTETSENLDNFSELALFTSSGRVIVDNIPFTSVYDCKMEYLSNGDVLRKRAVMFNDLSPIQNSWVVCIIDNLVSRMIEAGFIKTSVDSPDILREVV